MSTDGIQPTSTGEDKQPGRLSPTNMSERGRASQKGKARVIFSSSVQNIDRFITEQILDNSNVEDMDKMWTELKVYRHEFTNSFSRIEYLTLEGETIPPADQKLYEETVEKILTFQRQLTVRQELLVNAQPEKAPSHHSNASSRTSQKRLAMYNASLAEMKLAAETLKQEAEMSKLIQEQKYQQMELEHHQKVKNLELQVEVMSLKLKEKLECTDDDQLSEIEFHRESLLESLKTRQPASNYADTNIQNQVSGNETDTQPTPLKVPDQSESSTKTPLTCDVDKLSQLMARTTLPPLKPMVFKGDKLCYQKWRSSFRICFEKRTDDPDELLNYLAEYTSGDAFKLIESNLHIPSIDNFNKAMTKLEDQYGNPEAICTAYVDKLKDWEKIKPYDVIALRDLANYLDSCYESLKGFGKINKLDESLVLTNAMDIIPASLKSNFLEEIGKIRDNNSEPTFKHFVNFVCRKSKALSDPVFGFKPIVPKPTTATKSTDRRHRFRASGNSTTSSKPDSSVAPTKRDGNSTTSSKYDNSAASTKRDPESKPTPYCLYCITGGHWLEHCPKLREKPIQDRKTFLKTRNMCYKCTFKGHAPDDCPNAHWKICKVCDQKGHISLFHPDKHQTEVMQLHPSAAQYKPTLKSTSNVAGSNKPMDNEDSSDIDDLAHITLGYIRHKDLPDNLTECYIYSDAEADSCFLDSDFASEQTWKGPEVAIELTTMHGTKTIHSEQIKDLEILNLDKTEVFELPACYTRDKLPISRNQIPTKSAAKAFEHLRNIVDKIPEKASAPIALMIGRNVPLATSPREVIPPVSATSSWAERNGLGWSILYARKPTHITCNYLNVRNPTSNKDDNFLMIAEPESVRDVTTRDLLRLFDREFSEDSCDANGPSREDDRFVTIATNSITLIDNHYTVDLLFRHNPPHLGDNRHTAEQSLSRLRKRFIRDSNYATEYTQFMEEAIKIGAISKIPENHQPTVQPHYLTHHGVYHKRKHKIRVVFNASLKHGRSLNDELLKGPDYLTNLTGTLCRMRKHTIAFTCDIASMFMMVGVPETQRDYIRLLWWENGNYMESPIVYHINYHLFGAVSSPACCIFALRQTVHDNLNDCSEEVAEFVLNDFYMDDGCSSADSIDTAVNIAKGAIEVCSRGGFNLCKFASNSKPFLQQLPADKRSQDLTEFFDFDIDHLPQQRTLGMIWDVENDVLKYKVDIQDSTLSRRGCLSSLSTIFDPMGLIAPLLLPGKRILQEACRIKLQWDEPLPAELQHDWFTWKSGLKNLHQLTIPRCHKSPEFGNVVQPELHCFSDASTTGYGCCAYLRLENESGEIEVSLIMGKSRVTPLKPVTIPRLELTGAVTMTKLSTLLKRELRIDNLPVYFWTDSTVVLGYIRNECRRFKTFVSNRIQRILNVSTPDQWHHIPSSSNPADYASRGVRSATDLEDCLWFTGPKFLYETNKFWLQPDQHDYQIDNSDAEIRTTYRVMAVKAKPEPIDIQKVFQKIGSWNKLRTIVAVWNHLAKIYRSRRRGVQINPKFEKSAGTLENAELTIIRLLQKEAFPEEVHTLTNDRRSNIKKSSDVIRLSPFLDDDGILRVGGRIKNSSMTYDEAHLIIIPKKGHLPRLLVLHYHQKCHHSGRNITLNLLRSRYWLINGSSLVQRILSDCTTCIKLRGRPLVQKMNDLPFDRTNEAPPFTYSACDIFGPFLIKVKRSEVKRYGLLFSCQASRAVHLEVLHSLTTDSFLCGLRRFICRRGQVKVIRSDRGSQIIGAVNELQKLIGDLDQSKLKSSILQQFDCDLTFIPSTPYAPHFHGAWERQIGTIRRILESLLHQHKSRLTDETLETFLIEAEAVANSKPLTVESISDPELKPLSPSNLLTMKSGIILPPPGNFVQQDMYLHRQWRKVQFMVNEFWTRWKKEVLQSYQERQKWHRPVRNLRNGDIVLFIDDNLSRNNWPMMIVTKPYVNEDGLVRKVDITTTKDIGGKLQRVTYTRAVQKLILLVPNISE